MTYEVRLCIDIDMYIILYLYVYICMYIMYVYLYICMCIRMYIYIYLYMYINIYICMHSFLCGSQSTTDQAKMRAIDKFGYRLWFSWSSQCFFITDEATWPCGLTPLQGFFKVALIWREILWCSVHRRSRLRGPTRPRCEPWIRLGTASAIIFRRKVFYSGPAMTRDTVMFCEQEIVV